jgi:hypothetical protein
MEKYKCITCGFIGTDEEYIETETYCECCGEHLAYKCPNCDEVYDNVWDKREEIIV